MATHFSVPGMATGGYVGVTIFFTLSGFLITTLLVEERARTGRVDLIAFYRRRAYRLLPALAVMLTIFLVFEAARGDLAFATPRVLAAFFYVGNWVNAAINLGGLSHTWSLGVEEQFYALWPAVLIAVLALATRRWLALVAVAFAVATIGAREVGFVAAGLERSIDALMAGALLAIIATAGKMPSTWVLGAIGLVVLFAASIVDWSNAPGNWVIALPVVALATAGLVIAACAGDNPVATVLGSRPLVRIGQISYALYLWHYIVYWVAQPVADDLFWAVRVLILGAVSFAFAFASWRYVEQPVLRVTKRSTPALAVAS